MCRRCSAAGGRAFTLLELMIATTVMTVIVGSLAALGHGVQQSSEYNDAYGTVTQHARVTLERISRTINAAMANNSFPGVLALAESDNGVSFPDTLVVWRPNGVPSPTALPRYQELVVYGFDPAVPNQLVEFTNPSDARTVPAITDLSTWATEIRAMKLSAAAKKVALTPLLRTCQATSGLRGAVRFAVRLAPSDSEWNAFLAGTKTWQQLYWVQGTYGAKTGLRQAWVRYELQLAPTSHTAVSNAAALGAIPFFGSGCVYYSLQKP